MIQTAFHRINPGVQRFCLPESIRCIFFESNTGFAMIKQYACHEYRFKDMGQAVRSVDYTFVRMAGDTVPAAFCDVAHRHSDESA